MLPSSALRQDGVKIVRIDVRVASRVGSGTSRARYYEVMSEALSIAAVVVYGVLAVLVVRLSLWIIGSHTDSRRASTGGRK